MSYLKTATIDRIRAELSATGRKTTKQLVFVLGVGEQGIASCLLGMRRRGEVTRSIVKPGSPAVWRLT